MSIIAGSIVEYEGKERTPMMGVVLSVSAKGVRVLLLNRKETTVTERSILHSGGPSRVSVGNLDAAYEGAQRIDQKRSETAAGIDLAGLHTLLAEDQRPYGLSELAGFIASAADDDFEAALLRRLHADPWYFKGKKEGWVPVPVEEAEAAVEREKKRLEQEREDDELVAALKQTPRPDQPLPETIAGIADHLVSAAVFGSEAPVPRKIRELLDRAGMAQDRKLFAYLVRVGVFKPDENLLLRKYRIPVEFSDDVLAAAGDIAARAVDSTGRRDRRGISTWAIDSEGTRDRDDAFSILPDKDGGFILEVHIADPAAFISAGTVLEHEACRRGATLYLPDGNIPMLPPAISEDALGLNPDADRLALTVHMHFGPGGETISSKLEETVIRVTHATDYISADVIHADGNDELAAAVRLAGLLRERRRQSGAILIERQPERKIKLDGEIVKLGWRAANSPTQETVAEFMIWANHVAAAWCRDHGTACLYRTQDAPDEQVEMSESFDPVRFYAALRRFKKTVVTVQPGRHCSLGIEPYCQITSPLRRYGDLLLHRQIKAVLSGGPAPFDANGLEQAAMMAEEAVRTSDEVMRNREWYYTLKYLKQEQAEGRDVSPGTVVEVGNNDVTVYVEQTADFRHTRKPAFDVAAGQRLMVRFRQIDPFDGILRIELEQMHESVSEG